MSAVKALVKKRAVQRFLSWLAHIYIRFVYLTGRWRMVGIDHDLVDGSRPLIVAFWHGRMLMMPCARPRAMTFSMLISRHGDGVLIADAISHFNVGTVQGSTQRRGAEALREILRTLNDGTSVGITPDGPRGPRMRCAGAIADIARLSGVPILPATYSAKWRLILGSWDRFLLPLPFTRGVYVVGDPMDVAPDDDMPSTINRLENVLNELTRRADTMMGVETVEPAMLEPAGASQT